MTTKKTIDSIQGRQKLEYRHKQRVERAIARLGAGNLNNTRWIEVFTIIRCQSRILSPFRYKLVYDDKVLETPQFFQVNRIWADALYGPFKFSEIEWIEIRGQDADEIRAEIQILGRLPVAVIDGGFRIQACGLVLEPAR